MTLGQTVRLIAVPVLLAAALSGCAAKKDDRTVASAPGNPTASAGPAASQATDAAAQGRKFAQCMRDNGVDMADPGPDGIIPLNVDKSDEVKVTAASKKCREFLPNGGEPAKMSAQDIAKRRDFASCIRANGLPDFPDPDPDTGRFSVSKDKANILDKLGDVAPKCQQLGLPKGAMPAVGIDG
jgi:hypothetical protein